MELVLIKFRPIILKCDFRITERHYFEDVVVCDHDCFLPDVAVDDIICVTVVESGQELLHVSGCIFFTETVPTHLNFIH